MICLRTYLDMQHTLRLVPVKRQKYRVGRPYPSLLPEKQPDTSPHPPENHPPPPSPPHHPLTPDRRRQIATIKNEYKKANYQKQVTFVFKDTLFPELFQPIHVITIACLIEFLVNVEGYTNGYRCFEKVYRG